MRLLILAFFVATIFFSSCENQVKSPKYLGQTISEMQPELFGPNFISLDSTGEWMMSASYDGLELYFPRNTYLPNGRKRVRGYFTKYDGEKWIIPQPQKKFRRAPFFVSDTLGIMRYKNCIWKTTKENGSDWSEPEFIDSLDLGNGVTDWHITKNLQLFYVQDGNLKTAQITNSGITDFEKLNGFGDFKTRHVGVSPKGDYLLCDGFIEGINTGWVNLYISHKIADNEWTFPKHLDQAINTKDDGNYLPKISPDGEVLFFTRSDSTDRSDIYWISTKGLEKYK